MVSIYSAAKGETTTGTGTYVAPVTRALKGIHFLVDSAAKLAHNFVEDGINGSVTGAPTITSQYAQMTDNTNYVDTGVPESALMTFFLIAKSDQDFSSIDGAMLFSTNGNTVQSGGTSTFGTSLYMTASGITFGSSRNNAGTATSASAAISGNANATWALYQLEVTATGNTITNLTTGATATNSTGSTKILTNGNFRLGANFTASYVGTSKLMAWVAHHDVLTADEKASWAARLRTYASSKGVTV
jgi:hypothetical protein